MTEIHVVAAELDSAATATSDAASAARTGHGAEHIAAAATGMPGSTSAEMLTAMAPDWESEVEAWSDLADAFATNVAAHSSDMSGADTAEGARLGAIAGALGGAAAGVVRGAGGR